MPSSYTASARFTLQATGENNNTWGVILNNGVFQLVDDTINGRIGLALSGSHALTTALGATDEARMRFIDVTGGSGGTITIPSVPKGYFVRNGASGPVTISAGGTNTVFQPGDAAQVHTDGSTVYQPMIGGKTIQGYVDYQIMGATFTTPPIFGQQGKVLSNDGGFPGALTWTSSLPTLTLGTLSVTGNTTVGGTLGVTGASTFSTISTTGLATLASAGVTGAATVGGTLGVTGTTTLGVLNTSGLTTHSAGLTVSAGNTSLTTLSTSGLATLASASVTGTLGVTGTSSLGVLNTSGLTTHSAGLTVSAGNTSLTTLSTSGLATLASASITGTATVGAGLTLSGGLTIQTGGLTVQAGSITVTNGNVTVNGDVYSQRTGGAANTGVVFLGNAGAYLFFDGTNYILNGNHTLNNGSGGITCGALGANSGLGGFQAISMLSSQGQAGGPYGYAGGFYAPPNAYGAIMERIDQTSQYFHLFEYAGGTVGSIRSTDGATTQYNTTSDERLKDFKGPYSAADATAIIKADPVRAFTWNDLSASPGGSAVGWGAQTSYAVSPDLASPAVNEDVGEDGKPLHLWGTDQSKRTPYLWAAIGADGGILDRLAALEAAVAKLSGGKGLFR